MFQVQGSQVDFPTMRLFWSGIAGYWQKMTLWQWHIRLFSSDPELIQLCEKFVDAENQNL